MIPRINPRGASFNGITSYLLYGKERTDTPERVDWTHTGNMHTQDVEKASKVMAFTAMHAEDLKRENGGSLAGAKAEGKSVSHNSLAWRVGDAPSAEHMKQAALDYIEHRGLSDHEYYMVAHNDTDHKHLHIVVNLVHPETGKTKELGLDKRAAQEWALEYEKKHGIQCKLREENAAKREQGEHVNERHQNSKSTKQDYTTEITRAYYASDDGRSFKNALDAEGLTLAKGRKNNFVVVDKNGDIQNLSRQLDIDERGKAKTAAIQNLLENVEREKLQEADVLAKEIKEQNAEQLEYFDRDAQEVKQQKELEDAAHQAGFKKARDEEIEEARLKGEKRILSERIGILKQVKQSWADLKPRHAQERKTLEKELRALDSTKEKEHRGHWQKIIDNEAQRQEQLETDLNKNGVAGLWFRIRRGKDARLEIKALDKNIENAQSRLHEGVGGLSRLDRYQLMQLGKRQRAERQELRKQIDKDLQVNAERKGNADKLFKEAAANPENTGLLKKAIAAAKTPKQKGAANRLRVQAETQKAKEAEVQEERPTVEQWREKARDPAQESDIENASDKTKTKYDRLMQEQRDKSKDTEPDQSKIREEYKRIMQQKQNEAINENQNAVDTPDNREAQKRDLER